MNREKLSTHIYEKVENITKSFETGNFVDEPGIEYAEDLSQRIGALQANMQNVEVIR